MKLFTSIQKLHIKHKKAKIYYIIYIQEFNILFALFNTSEVTMKRVLKIKHEKNAQKRINQTKLFI